MKKPKKSAPLADVDLTIYYDRVAKLSPDEKMALRGMLENPVFIKLMRVCEGMKPSSNCTGAGSGPRDVCGNDRANARLGEMRGWELHLLAMYSALNEAPPVRTEVEEKFPASGLLKTEPEMPTK